MKHRISVARDFSKTPGPRFIKQGSWSGEKFRQLLEKQLKTHHSLIVDLDGTRGYGSSFLDEAFGGLIRECVLTKREFDERIKILSDEDPTYLAEAMESVRLAQPKQ